MIRTKIKWFYEWYSALEHIDAGWVVVICNMVFIVFGPSKSHTSGNNGGRHSGGLFKAFDVLPRRHDQAERMSAWF